MSLGEIPRLDRLTSLNVIPADANVASACASGLSVTVLEDAGAS
jgi:hypothetical protein